MNSKQEKIINNIIKEIDTYKIPRDTLFLDKLKQRLNESLKRYDESLSECINILSLENQIKLARKLVE